MRSCHHARFRQQATFLRRQFLQDDELPLTDVLSERSVAQALAAVKVVWLDRVYSPLVTLWVFLGQVLSRDHSCRGAVARLIVHRVSRGQRPCSAETGAYCQARKRLPEEFFSEVGRDRRITSGCRAEVGYTGGWRYSIFLTPHSRQWSRDPLSFGRGRPHEVVL